MNGTSGCWSANSEQKNGWLETAKTALDALQREHEKQTEELDKSNRWAEELNAEVAARGVRVVALQGELAAEQERARALAEGYAAKVAALEDDIREKTQWAIDVETSLKADVAKQTAELVRAVEALHHTEKELDEPHRVGAQSRSRASYRAGAGGALPRIAMGQAGPQGRIRSGLPGELKWRC